MPNDKKYKSVATNDILTANVLIPTSIEPIDKATPTPLIDHPYNIDASLKPPAGVIIDRGLAYSSLIKNVAYVIPIRTIVHDKTAVSTASGGNVFCRIFIS